MSIRIIRLGEPRKPDEGTRIGTVRRPPRGVRKERYATDNWFDVWLPYLAPSAELMLQAKAVTTLTGWQAFVRAFEAEMEAPVAQQTLDLLAVLSSHANLSLGCYCDNEVRCHRSILRRMLESRGARFAQP